jgi:hypothetical protein
MNALMNERLLTCWRSIQHEMWPAHLQHKPKLPLVLLLEGLGRICLAVRGKRGHHGDIRPIVPQVQVPLHASLILLEALHA